MIALDGTDTKARLGANALLAVSMARRMQRQRSRGSLCIAIEKSGELYCPVPMMNIIQRGSHADNSVDLQES